MRMLDKHLGQRLDSCYFASDGSPFGSSPVRGTQVMQCQEVWYVVGTTYPATPCFLPYGHLNNHRSANGIIAWKPSR